MNIDFHVHGLLSKRKDFNKYFFLNEVLFAKDSGIDAIVLCEHYNAVEFNTIYKFLEDNYPYEGDRYIVEGVSIFPAMEVSIKGKGHVIIITERDSILDMRKQLEYNIISKDHIEFEALLDLADIYNSIKIGAHPCRKGHKLFRHDEELLKRLDGIDLNGKDIYRKGKSVDLDELIDLSNRIGVNIVTGSDSHTPLQLGGLYTSLNKECGTIDELKECIITNNYSIEIKPSLDFRVYSSKILKRHLMGLQNYNKDFEFKI